jgi:hypothetical protein
LNISALAINGVSTKAFDFGALQAVRDRLASALAAA